jgi:hypothetical protein
VSSITGRRDPEPGRRRAVDRERRLEALVLLLAPHVVQLGTRAERGEDARRLARQLARVGVLERVLVLRAADAGRDGEVLHRLEVEVHALDAGELRLEAADDVGRRQLPLGERLQVDEDAAAVERDVRCRRCR